MSSENDSFERTLRSFKTRLTQKEREDFQFATLEDVRKVIARIQNEQEGTKAMMNMSRIQSFLEAMEQFGKVIEVFLNASSLVAFVWGPMKFLLQTASNWADSFEILLEAYEQIGEEIPLLEQYKAIFDYSPYMRKVLGLIYFDILEFHKRAIRFFSGRVWHQVFRSAWKDFGTRFKHILDSLRRHKELIQSQAHLLYFQQYQQDSQAALLHIQQYEQNRLQVLDKLGTLEETESEKKYIAVMEWISGANTKLDHESFRDIRHEYPGSGDWILKHEKIQNWKEADTPVSSILWLNGIPGAGKTILASVVIDSCMDDQLFTTGYFYCRGSDPEKNNCTSIFKGLLNQLLSQCRDLVPYCHDRHLSSGELTLTSPGLTKQLLELFCQRIQKQYIIIDGLDECDPTERKLVLSFLNVMVDRCDMYQPGKLRVLFVSQDYNDIRKALPTAAIISLGPTDNENDIKAYVKEWAMNIQRKFGLEKDQVDLIITLTCARARGMFLFAKLVMPNLYKLTSRPQLLEEIKTSRFPRGLEGAYERIMSRIKQDASFEEWKIAQKLLGWMVCARRPLKWHEIQGAVSIDPVEQTIDFDDRKLRIHIRDLCGSLIQVLPGDRVELVHSTAKMYITRSGLVREATVECNLTALCLQYLTFECFGKDIERDRLHDFALKGYFAFQDYAIAKWFHHLRAMVDAGQDLFLGGSDNWTALEEIEVALDDFANSYEEDILHEPAVGASEEACKVFKNCRFYDNLLSVWSHIYRHQDKGFKARNDVSIKVLGETLIRNRQLMEGPPLSNMYPSSGKTRDIGSFYGEKLYKCPKLTCFYFHEGFKDAKSRDVHINRHDRPFNCTFPDCSMAEFGFSSNKDLEKHTRAFHPDISDLANSFAAAAAAPAKTPFDCRQCSKRFTRKLHLRSHELNHAGTRPYDCPECGKSFTRLNDRKRHEKIHARR
ncbi:MAG: hypothetical protein M1813_007239 [Trichoglossum hirsutum]|nr:MAG: hypothetical protein M1813_007239 [Trichoglossum hirsutum]